MRRAFPLLLIALSVPAAAQPSRNELSRIEAEQQAREQLRDQQRGDAEAIRREIAELNAQLAELNAAQGEGKQGVSERRLKLAALSAREAQLSERMAANQNELSRLLGALQMFSKSPPPALFVNPRDARDAVRAAILIRAVTPELQRRADGFALQAGEVQRVRRDAAAQAEALFTSESDVADRAARIETLVAEKIALERGLTTEAVIADQDIARLAARAAALRTVIKGLPTPARPVAGGKLTKLVPPVAGAPVRRFGVADAAGRRSEGWSWRPTSATSVASPAVGIVEYAGPVAGWKNVVIVGAGDGHHLVLAGLDTVSATPGQSVAAGQVVGRIAMAADMGVRSEASELRLEIRKGGQAIDPARFMQGR